eukprot:1351297-Rhodomonas_salina.1
MTAVSGPFPVQYRALCGNLVWAISAWDISSLGSVVYQYRTLQSKHMLSSCVFAISEPMPVPDIAQ